jgi:hypothetical protein
VGVVKPQHASLSIIVVLLKIKLIILFIILNVNHLSAVLWNTSIIVIHYSDQLNTFFTYKGSSFALIRNHQSQKLFSYMFASSSYHSLISKFIDSYFHILQSDGSTFHHVPIQRILNLCIVFQKDSFIIVIPISNAYEHD